MLQKKTRAWCGWEKLVHKNSLPVKVLIFPKSPNGLFWKRSRLLTFNASFPGVFLRLFKTQPRDPPTVLVCNIFTKEVMLYLEVLTCGLACQFINLILLLRFQDFAAALDLQTFLL